MRQTRSLLKSAGVDIEDKEKQTQEKFLRKGANVPANQKLSAGSNQENGSWALRYLMRKPTRLSSQLHRDAIH